MLPQEWVDMGGEICDQCSTCIASEWCAIAIDLNDSLTHIHDE